MIKRFGGQQQCRNAGRVLQRGPHDLGRIDHAGSNEVAVLVLVGIIALVFAFEVLHAVDDNGAIDAGILGNRPQREVENVADDFRAVLFVTFEAELVQGAFAANQSHAAAGDNTLFQGCLGGAFGVFQQGLAFLHFGFGCRTAVDLSNATGQLGQAFLEFFAVVVAVGRFDRFANLVRPAVDFDLLAGTADNRRYVGRDGDLFGLTEIGELDRVERDTQVFEDGSAGGQHGEIAEHFLAAIAVAGGLDGTSAQRCRAFC